VELEVGYLLIHGIISVVIVLGLGKVHELLHARKAIQLGYKVRNFKLLGWKNETDIDIEIDNPDLIKIARAPYYVLMPFGIIMLLVGFWFMTFFLIISGAGVVFIHSLTYWKEIEDDDVPKVSSPRS